MYRDIIDIYSIEKLIIYLKRLYILYIYTHTHVHVHMLIHLHSNTPRLVMYAAICVRIACHEIYYINNNKKKKKEEEAEVRATRRVTHAQDEI